MVIRKNTGFMVESTGYNNGGLDQSTGICVKAFLYNMCITFTSYLLVLEVLSVEATSYYPGMPFFNVKHFCHMIWNCTTGL